MVDKLLQVWHNSAIQRSAAGITHTSEKGEIGGDDQPEKESSSRGQRSQKRLYHVIFQRTRNAATTR